MLASLLTALAVSVATVNAQAYQGFNYGSVFTDQSPITEPAYEAQFNAAKNLVGASGFSSARLFTTIQAGTQNTPSDAIQAAINTDTSLLLGFWGSAGQANIDNELAALRAAIDAHGETFTNLVAGISVGSEDLYRISPTGIENESGVGAGPDVIADYIGQVKDAITNTPLAGKQVGHVDTWTAWVNSSNNAVISASDFIGMDAYPYFQNTMTNDIGSGYSLFFSAYDQTVAAAQGKPVWVTETGWPVSGETENLAVPSTDNAETYWDQVGCSRLFGNINTWWFTLQDGFPSAPSPSFGVVGAGSSSIDVPTTPLYDLSCSDASSDAPASSSIAPSSANPAASERPVGNTGASRQNVAEGGSGSSGSAGSSDGASSGAASSGGASSASAPSASAPVRGSASAQSPTPQSSAPSASNAGAGSHEQNTNTAGPPPSNAPVPTTLITTTTAQPNVPAQTNCPAPLKGQFEYPHLIVPVSKNQPDTAQGTSFNGTISPSTSSIFNFDFSASLEGKTCTLVFLFPKQDELTTSAFTLTGSGGFEVLRLNEPATEQTTYNTVPEVDESLGTFDNVTPGQEYEIAGGACYFNNRRAYEIRATGSFDLNYFQDYNPAPIGLYVTVC